MSDRVRTVGLIVALMVACVSRARAQGGSVEAGTLVVRVSPPAALYIDGRLTAAVATDEEVALAPGLHRVRLVHSDYLDVRRTVSIKPRVTLTLDLPLAERAVRRPPPAPTSRGRGTAAAAPPPRLSMTITDADVAQGAQFVAEGDFEPAIETLQASARNLAGTPRLFGQRALAYVYLGVAFGSVDLPSQAEAGLCARAAYSIAR